jgi:S1-C subfamily serine protease
VVVARGNIKLGGYVSGSAVIAGGKVMVGKTLKPPLRERLVIEENVRRPLGFVSFFELDQVGVEVATADGGVRVMGLMAGKPLAAAGVQKGDLVTKVGGSAVGSPEELRRQLRDASGTRGEARLTIRRGGETVELRVVIPD